MSAKKFNLHHIFNHSGSVFANSLLINWFNRVKKMGVMSPYKEKQIYNLHLHTESSAFSWEVIVIDVVLPFRSFNLQYRPFSWNPSIIITSLPTTQVLHVIGNAEAMLEVFLENKRADIFSKRDNLLGNFSSLNVI